MQRLELTWIGKNEEPKLEPRILLEQPEYRCGAPNPDGQWQGMLIHGDNLLALKALEQQFAGQVKCIYIDPPYNTGSAFEHYDDGIEHSLWLSLIRDRLKLLRHLLSDDGSIWISIDDNECHYLKVLCDEVFGRGNFVANVIWQKRTSPDNRATLGAGHDHIIVFARHFERFRQVIGRLNKTPDQIAQFKNPDNDPRGPWVSSDYTAQGYRPNQMYKIETPGGKVYSPPPGTCWKNIEEGYLKLKEEGRMWYGKNGNAMPRRKTYLYEQDGQVAWTWWPNTEVGNTQEAKKEIIALFGPGNIFDTPKPERLIERILTLATHPGDLVLDSFLGSGTTAAVAHKMGRRWIGIELGQHAYSHCLPRLQKVVWGQDPGGITKSAGWTAGGGFRMFGLASTLLREDRFGHLVINPEYNAQMLAAALCRHEGYRYEPDAGLWWKQGRGNGQDYLLTTTQHVTRAYIDSIQEDMRPGESLLICCKSYDAACATAYPDITLKKIPSMLLDRCEFGRDDYSLHIVPQPGEPEATPEEWTPPLPPKPEAPHQGSLF
ncbi:MAG: site-specific DNA-methyltransferase [Saprospiraceae bacterium]|nr:site-specific DNA-methyltransferase [Saprospiraceae bacterium]